MLEALGKRPVTIRTLDIGADKYPPYMRVPREDNPFLGWRSIRISLEMSGLFKVQLRAILRAAAKHNVRIMFPMISSLEELRRAKELLAESQAELFKEGLEHNPEYRSRNHGRGAVGGVAGAAAGRARSIFSRSAPTI